MEQYGFYFDCNICIGCGACQFACREANQLPKEQYFRRLLRLKKESGLGYIGFFSSGCMHCLEPACVLACPNGAMYRDEERGLVLHDSGRCIGCMCLGLPLRRCFHQPRNGKSKKIHRMHCAPGTGTGTGLRCRLPGKGAAFWPDHAM